MQIKLNLFTCNQLLPISKGAANRQSQLLIAVLFFRAARLKALVRCTIKSCNMPERMGGTRAN